MLHILLQMETTGGLSSFLPIILIIFVFYFFMIRPQVNKQRSEDNFRSNIKKGDKVVTIGGIHGRINQIKESKIILEIGENSRISIDKNCISKDRSSNIKSQ